MNCGKLTLPIFAAALLAAPSFAQQKENSSTCVAEYENHNQIDYGPLVVQDVKARSPTRSRLQFRKRAWDSLQKEITS